MGSHGDTSIIWAAEKGKKISFQAAGAYTANLSSNISISVLLGFERIVRMLIERGANVNAVNSGHNSALIYAAVNGNISNENSFSRQIKICETFICRT